jgi:hypothetical protein
MGYEIDRADIFSIGSDWMYCHREIVGRDGWKDEAVSGCMKMYPEVEWTEKTIEALKEELEWLRPVR